MKSSVCPNGSPCEFKGTSVCPFPNPPNRGKCIYYVPSPCEKCSLKGSPYIRSGDPESGVMVVGGSNYDSMWDSILALLSAIYVELNIHTLIPYYYTTAVKCITDKKPSMALIKRCNSYLKEEIDIIKPKYVLVIGETAFKALLWDFDLITRRKPEIDSCAGSHIEKDGVIYFVINDLNTIEQSYSKQVAFKEHLIKFVQLINGLKSIQPVNYKEVDCEKDLIYIATEAEKTGRVSVDIETDPLTAFLPDSEILTMSLTVKEGESFCIPLSWPTGNYFKKWDFTPKMNPLLAILYIKKIFSNPNIVKIFHNGSYDITWLEHIFSCEVKNYDDTMIMKYLMKRSDWDPKGLKPLTKELLDMGYYEYQIKQYVGENEPYSNIPPEILMRYNNSDTDATLRLWNIFRLQLKELKLNDIHYNFMIPNLRGIINLQKTGVALDVNKCIQMKEENENRLIELFSELRTLPQVAKFERETMMEFMPTSDKHKFALVYGGEVTTGEEMPRKINPKTGKKIGKKVPIKVVYQDGFNLTPITVSKKNAKTGKREERISFSKDAIKKYLKSIYKDIQYLDPINTFDLESLPSDTDIMKFIKLVSEIGTIQTQLSNHIEPFINVWSKTVDRCVHTSYDITGTTTGRLSSRAPNLQNLTREGFVKEAFVSRWGDEGILLEVDYKQLELFVMAIVSQDPKFVHAFTNGIDLHKKVAANIVFRCDEKDVSKQMRTMAKTVNFGMIYGKTPFTLKDDLNVTEEEAKRILEGYFVEYSGVKNYCDRVKNFAQTNGFVTTVMGRRRYLDYSDRNGADRQAVNTTIQSPASDVCVTAVNQLQVYFAKIADDLMVKLVGKVFDINSRKKEEAALVCGTVHDSILVDCKKKYVNEIVQSAVIIMEHTGLPWITIPLKVDVKYGPNLRHMIEWDGEEIIL